MKTRFINFAVLLISALTVSITITPTQANGTTHSKQSPDKPISYVTLRGIVKDKNNNRILEYANISLKGTSIGTITNTNGLFSLKIEKGMENSVIEISHIGYNSVSIPAERIANQEMEIYLEPLPGLLDQITIKAIDAKELVKKAIEETEHNYSKEPQLLTGFYRETIRKRKKYINVSEAVVEIFKRAYTEDFKRDLLAVYKGRKLISTKPEDTVMIKFLGGPNLALYLDIVKSPDLMLSKENLNKYKFSIKEIAMIEDRPHYVVNFEPQAIMHYALHHGKLFIDRSSFAISRAEINVDMTDRNKVTKALLKRKPLRMKFKPESISYLVTYKEAEGKTNLSYIRSEIEFKCDWKRKLFSTNYTIVSETVITGEKKENIEKISHRTAFKDKSSLSDKVMDFYDQNYWENYNIIEPDESLEKAVSRLIKQQQ